MAGPCAGIYVERVLTELVRIEIRSVMSKLGIHNKAFDDTTDDYSVANTTLIGGTYVGDPRPFLLLLGFEYPEEPEECCLALGWTPKDRVYFCAMCNGDQDHLILGELCLFFAKKFSGVVSFNGGIEDYTKDPKIVEAKGVIDHETETFFWPEAFQLWLKHPLFRMVK